MKISRVKKNDSWQWRVAFMIEGKEQRKFFHNEQDAKAHARELESNLQKHGTEWMSISHTERLDCLGALEVSRKRGFSLMEAVKAYANHHTPADQIPTVEQAKEKCVERRIAMNLRPRSIRSLEQTLNVFCREFGEVRVDVARAPQIEIWINAQSKNPWTRKTKRTDVFTLFSFCVSMDWILKNPVSKIPAPLIDDSPPEILTVDQCEKLLAECQKSDPGMLSFFTLCLFCGVRPQEVLRLKREAVDLDRKIVLVEVSSSKTRQRRITTISENALAWLSIDCTLPLINWRNRWHRVRRASGLFEQWPHDCMRHSFGSYHYALHESAEKTSFQMGNSPDILFEHYRELVTKEDAKAFFEIYPELQPASA